jgi:hypothetical protein
VIAAARANRDPALGLTLQLTARHTSRQSTSTKIGQTRSLARVSERPETTGAASARDESRYSLDALTQLLFSPALAEVVLSPALATPARLVSARWRTAAPLVPMGSSKEDRTPRLSRGVEMISVLRSLVTALGDCSHAAGRGMRAAPQG